MMPPLPSSPRCIGSIETNTVVDVIYRDFNSSHPDFQMGLYDTAAVTGLVKQELGSDGKPQFLSPLDRFGRDMISNNGAYFHEWYTDVPGRNKRVDATIELDYDPSTGLSTFTSIAFFPGTRRSPCTPRITACIISQCNAR